MNTPDRDCDVAATIALADLDPTDAFRARLRADLVTEAAGDDVVSLRPSNAADRRPWTIVLAAAAAVVLVVALAVVTRPGGGDGTVPATEPADETRTGDLLSDGALAAQLVDRTWVALERFDVPVAPTRTATVSFARNRDAMSMTVVDCATAVIAFEFDATVVTDADGDAGDCARDALAVEPGQRIAMDDGADRFTLIGIDGAPLAELTDVATLPVPTDDELLATPWYSDRMGALDFDWPDMVRVGLCTRLVWERGPDDVIVSLGDPLGGSCSDGRLSIDIETPVRTVIEPTAHVRATADGILLYSPAGALLLRRLPDVEADPTGVTLAAGAVFGIETGAGVTPEDLAAAAEPTLGSPDADTGWVDMPPFEQGDPFRTCGGSEYRELVWGDLIAGFYGRGSRSTLGFWHVGDRPLGSTLPPIEHPEPSGTSGLVTEDGVGVGDAATQIAPRFGRTMSDQAIDTPAGAVQIVTLASANPDYRPGGIVEDGRSGQYFVVDGVVVGFGAELFTC